MAHVTEALDKDEDLVYQPAFTLWPEGPGAWRDPHSALQDHDAAILKTSALSLLFKNLLLSTAQPPS